MTEDDEHSEIILPFVPLISIEVVQTLKERLKQKELSLINTIATS